MLGRDFIMRSRSRFMTENPKEFLATLRDNGIADSIVQQIERQGIVLLALPVKTALVEAALRGKEGICTVNGYRNVETLSAYGPIDIDSVRWAIISEPIGIPTQVVQTGETMRQRPDYSHQNPVMCGYVVGPGSLAVFQHPE